MAKNKNWVKRMATILGKKTVGRLETLQYANKKFEWGNVVIGISAWYGFWAWILARLTKRKVIYYCIDFYSPEIAENWIDKIFIFLAMQLDKFLIHHVDYLWDISDKINEGRWIYGKYKRKSLIIPLSYPPNYLRYSNEHMKNIVFIGLNPYGKEIWPKDTEWLGKGNMKTPILLDELSVRGIGLSVWEKKGNNYYGDPGKTKLYSACGLPVIVTDNTPYADKIKETNAGIVVRYTKRDIERAARRIFKKYRYYKKNTLKTRKYINADHIFRNISILE